MSFPGYSAYKNSEVEWIGVVPHHWSMSRIKFDTTVKARVGWHGLKSDEFTEEGPYLVTGSDFRGKTIDWVSCYHCTEDRYTQDPYIQLSDGDLLITKDGTIGKLMVVTNLPGPATLNSGVFVVRPKHDYVSTEFFYWLLQSAVFHDFIAVRQTGSTINHLYQETFENLPYALPAAMEQTQIASFLDHETAKIDALIEQQQRLIELLKEKRQAVISHAVTKGLDPAVPMKDSGVEWIGEVPAHWKVTKFKWQLRTASGGTPPSVDRAAYYDGTIPWLRSLDLTDDLVTEFEVSVTSRAIAETSCKIVPKDSVLIAMYGGDGTIGKNGLLTFDSAINQAICAFLPSKTCSAEYLHRYVQFYRPYWMIGAESSRKDPNIGQDRIGDHFFVIPPLREQVDIVSFTIVELLKFSRLISEAELGVKLYYERRSALISAAVTGKIDVRYWKPPASESEQESQWEVAHG